MAAAKPSSQLKLLQILQDCKQIPKDDRLLIRKLLKDGDQQVVKILSDTNNKKLQVKLRKHIQKCKQNKKIQHVYENNTKNNTVNSKYIAALYEDENQNSRHHRGHKQNKDYSLSHSYNRMNQYSGSKSIHKSGCEKKSLQNGKAIRDFRQQLEQCKFMRPSASNNDIRMNLNVAFPPRPSTNTNNSEYKQKERQIQKEKPMCKTLKLSRNASGCQLNIGNNEISTNINNYTSNTALQYKAIGLSNNWSFNNNNNNNISTNKYSIDYNYLKPQETNNNTNSMSNSYVNNNNMNMNMNMNMSSSFINNNNNNTNINNNSLFTAPQLLKWDKWDNKTNNNSNTLYNNININTNLPNITNITNITSGYNSHNSSLTNSRIQKQSIFSKPKQQHINLAAIDAMLRSSLQNNTSTNYNINTNLSSNIINSNTNTNNININNKQDIIYNFKCALIKYYAQDIFQYVINKYFPLSINDKSVYLPYKQFLQQIQNYLKGKGQNIQILNDNDINIPMLSPFTNQYQGVSIKNIGLFVNNYCLHKNNNIRGIFIVLDSVQCMVVSIDKFNRINSWKGKQLVQAFQKLVRKWGEANTINYWQVYRVRNQKQYVQFDGLYSKL